jgi:hypothetical protein
MAQTNVASAVALISLDDGAAPPILTQILTVNALFPSRRVLVPLLDGRSLARLNACARAFGKKDETSGRSFCENVARGRVLPLMRENLEGVRKIGGGNPGQLNQDFLARFYWYLAQEGELLFPPDGRTTPRWPPRWLPRDKGGRGLSGALHACDAFEAGPVAAWAAASAVHQLAVECLRTCPPENRPLGDAVCTAALRARRDAILARRGPCDVVIYTRTNTPADGAALSALVESQGGGSWVWDRTWESEVPATRYRGHATFPSLRRALEARLLSSELVQQVEFDLPGSVQRQLEGLDG